MDNMVGATLAVAFVEAAAAVAAAAAPAGSCLMWAIDLNGGRLTAAAAAAAAAMVAGDVGIEMMDVASEPKTLAEVVAVAAGMEAMAATCAVVALEVVVVEAVGMVDIVVLVVGVGGAGAAVEVRAGTTGVLGPASADKGSQAGPELAHNVASFVDSPLWCLK